MDDFIFGVFKNINPVNKKLHSVAIYILELLYLPEASNSGLRGGNIARASREIRVSELLSRTIYGTPGMFGLRNELGSYSGLSYFICCFNSLSK